MELIYKFTVKVPTIPLCNSELDGWEYNGGV